MKIAEILCQPIICGLSMALITWLILDFWQGILTYPHKKLPLNIVKLIIALVNGGMSLMAEIMTQNNASPRTIAIYMPIMVVLQIHIIGHMKSKWGAFAIFALTSIEFITLYSVSLGISNLMVDKEFMASRMGLVIPVTMMNLFLSLFLLSVKLYRISLKGDDRDKEIGEILNNYKSSMSLVIYSFVNAIAIMMLTYDAIDMLNYADGSNVFVREVCRNMIVRDLIMFLSAVLVLDLQSRNAKSENKAKNVIAQNILLERDKATQNMIQMGLEAARKDLEKKNKELSSQVEYERRLRASLHRNILFRFNCNVTKGVIDDAGALNIDNIKVGEHAGFEDVTKVFLELLVHPDHREALMEKMSIKHLLDIAYNEKGFKYSMQMSPSAFINYVTLDDNSAKIYAYVDREYIWTDMDCTVVIGEDGDVHAYFYVMDIDEQKQKEEAVQRAALTDALTGLANRRYFNQQLEEYVSKENNEGGALFMIDLDFFKSVNDNLGHPEGDKLLKNVADTLTHIFRHHDIVCRIGGDEFCVFAKGLTDKKLIMKKAEALNEAGRQTFDLPKGGKVNVSLSIGIAVIPEDAKDAKELYANADSALYKAKEAGRNGYKMFS